MIDHEKKIKQFFVEYEARFNRALAALSM